jgi:hypothetical protein
MTATMKAKATIFQKRPPLAAGAEVSITDDITGLSGKLVTGYS